MSLCLVLLVDRRLLDLQEDRFFESFFSSRHRVDEDLKGKDVRVNVCNESTTLRDATWIVKIMLVCVPLSSYPTPESRGEILV